MVCDSVSDSPTYMLLRSGSSVVFAVRINPFYVIACRALVSQVYDRCRGIDNDPVQPDPAPSRVSTQMSFVPKIKPAYCLGKPGEVRNGRCVEGFVSPASNLGMVFVHANDAKYVFLFCFV